jgi:hypothetical protein
VPIIMAENPGCTAWIGESVTGPEAGVTSPRAASTADANGWASATPPASIAMPMINLTMCMNCDMLSPFLSGPQAHLGPAQ